MSDTNILGDVNRKSRFNKDLADVVNKDVEDRLKKEARENKISKKKVKKTTENVTSIIGDFIIDTEPANSSATKRFDEWVDYWGSVNDGRSMASMSDYYNAFKQAWNGIDTNSKWKNEDRKFINGIRSILQGGVGSTYRILTSTRLKYGIGFAPGSLGETTTMSEVIHHYAFPTFGVRSQSVSLVPNCTLCPIVPALDDSVGLEYFHNIFGTEDDKETILKTLERVSGFTRDRISMNVEREKDRELYPERNIILISNGASGFCIDATFDVSESIKSNTKCFTYGVKYPLQGMERMRNE